MLNFRNVFLGTLYYDWVKNLDLQEFWINMCWINMQAHCEVYIISSKTLYNKIVNSPQNLKLLSVLSPVLGVGTNAFTIYQV